MKPQKKREHYFRKKYNGLERFISYFYQIDLVTGLRNMKEYESTKFDILEIGVGNRIVSDYLRRIGYGVTTVDIDPGLEPNYVADVRALPFEDSSFEVVTAFEVLEHLPWDDFERALLELKRVSRKYVIISLPYRSTAFEFVFKFPGARTLFQKAFIDLFLRIPLRFGGVKTSGQHYWEIDGYNYRLGKVKKILKDHFTRVKIIRPVLDGYRLFFILEK